jgi:predicted NUDIX family NTP pyrophosphohydrolase
MLYPRTTLDPTRGSAGAHVRPAFPIVGRSPSERRDVAATSAGVLLFRRGAEGLEVLLVHPGGPYWAHKDEGAWSIPKGLYDPAEESPLEAAQREFAEEVGSPAPGPFADLGEIHRPSGKLIRIFAAEGDLDADSATSNTFEMEWPRHSGRTEAFPEVDRAEWFDLGEARRRILAGQLGFIDRFEAAAGAAEA